jgi:hypothetical protein
VSHWRDAEEITLLRQQAPKCNHCYIQLNPAEQNLKAAPTWSVFRSIAPTSSSTFLNDMMAALLTADWLLLPPPLPPAAAAVLSLATAATAALDCPAALDVLAAASAPVLLPTELPPAAAAAWLELACSFAAAAAGAAAVGEPESGPAIGLVSV